jgi:hypothetical protein
VSSSDPQSGNPFDTWRQHRAQKRVKTGDGRPLTRFRWWQLLSRSLFYLRLTTADGDPAEYAVDVGHWGDATTGEVHAALYLNGRHHAESRTPAVFPVPGGSIEVRASAFGLKRCHFVSADGRQRQLTPDPASAEGMRANFDREHPAASRWIGQVTLVILVLGLALLVPQLIGYLSLIPPIADNFGTFTSPVELSTWANIVVTLITGAASTERALRLRHHWLLDGGAG